MEVIPAIDVLDGKVVRLVRGSYERVTTYGHDPVAAAAAWLESGATLVHLVDLEGARSGNPYPGLWRRFGRAGVPFQVGGGIRDATTAARALDEGAVRVVLGTAAVWRPEILAEIGRPGQVVAALDVIGYEARGDGWSGPGRPLFEVLGGLQALGVVRALVTAIARDGTMQGPDLDLIGAIRQAAPGVAVIASGGVGGIDDLVRLAAAGCEAVVVGKALYERRFSLEEALSSARTGGRSPLTP